jgi:cytochrome b561
VIGILAMAIIGLTMVEMPSSPDKVRMFALHKSIGLTILALVTLRLSWRLYAGTPPVIPTIPRWQAPHRQRFARRLVRVVVRDADQRLGDELGGGVSVVVVRPVPRAGARRARPRLHELTETVHETLFWLLILLVLVHAGAALYHHLFQRDATARAHVAARLAAGTDPRRGCPPWLIVNSCVAPRSRLRCARLRSARGHKITYRPPDRR